MGIAAYSRGSKLVAREISRELFSIHRTNETRARLLKELLERGCILSFKGNGGAIVTAGPHVVAVGESKFSMYRDHGDRSLRGSWVDGAWGIALRIIEHVGRRSPYKVTEKEEP